jgi:hypothetical protein
MDAPTADGAADVPGGTDAGSDAGQDTPDGAPDLRAALEGAGYVVADGSFEMLDLSDCCDPGRSCSGNNPTSPYGAIFLPRGPGQTVANPQEDARGLSFSWRLRDDEAIVVLGRTPPAAAYFGLTPYLMDRDSGLVRRPIFASIDDTTNDDTIEVDAPAGSSTFDQPFAMVITPHAGTEAAVRTALTGVGISRGTNTMVIDAATVRLGLDDPDDTLGVLFRVAIFDDDVAGAAWRDAPGWTVMRLSPATPASPDPLALPTPRPRDTTRTETALTSAVDRLEAAVRAANAGRAIRDLMVTDGALDPYECIAMERFCAGDNRDTIYPAAGPFRLQAGDSLYVLGVDHEATGKATYASASVYAIDHLVGLRAVTSREWAGSAEPWLPGDPDASQLFAWRIARDCTGDPACLTIPVGTCPDGAALDAFLALAFRAYVEPTTFTSPDSTTLVRERVLLVQAP